MNNIDVQSLEFYLNQKYKVSVYLEETGIYSSLILELPGCMSQGKSKLEALQNIEKARQYWITRSWKAGDKIPLPN